MSNVNDARREPATSHPPADLAHLHPGTLQPGGVGVLAGDWAWSGDPPRIPVGFVGTLIDRFFRTTMLIDIALCALAPSDIVIGRWRVRIMNRLV